MIYNLLSLVYNFQRGSLRIKCATNIFKGYFLWLCLTKWYICLLPRSILFSYQSLFFTSKIHLGNSCIWWTSLVGKTSYMKTKKAWIPLSPNWRKISYLYLWIHFFTLSTSSKPYIKSVFFSAKKTLLSICLIFI